MTGVVIALIMTTASATAGRRIYSTAPLKDPIRDAAANVVEFVKFNNWLNSNLESAPPERRQALKENLFSIIDSHVRQLHAREGTTSPRDSDPILSECFMWATRMGVPGAEMVLRRLNPQRAQEVAPPAPLPASFKLMLNDEVFVLSSSLDAWSVTFPYYFMPYDIREYETTNGLWTQLAIVSTGFARHSDGDGYSQATIMLVFSPAGSTSTFNDFWMEQFGLTVADALPEPVKGERAYRRYDPRLKMHSEVVFPSTGSGAMAIGYFGIDGTYQWNRPHFEDFLTNLQLKPAE
jgi:hypothetical protein